MVDPRSARFWQIATRCGLIEPAKLEECWNAIAPDKRTPDAIDRRLARQAVNSGYLTLWQAQQILAGRQHGLRIDRYVLVGMLGHGGMGRVYLARDTRLGRYVALKVLSRERVSNPRALARFKREAKVGAQLQHENLIRVYDEGEVAGMPYLVMEYIVGQTIAQLIAEQGRIDPPLAAELGRQVAEGLEHLHQKGLLHRDVNPTNILVDRGGTAKLTDLGLAIDLGDLEGVVTRDGATVGTFDYISPEQARNPRQIDTRSDIYSLGCTLYHMISGRVPFPAPSLPEKLFAHQSNEPEPLVSQVPGVPEGLDAVVRKLMAKHPDDRYSRPALVARALEPYARPLRAAFDEPVTPREPRRDPKPVAVANGNTVGSDPDLAILPGARPQGSNEPNPDLPDLLIDLGGETPISESRTSTRSRTQDRAVEIARVHWPYFVALAVIGTLLGLLLFTLNEPGGPGGETPKSTATTSQGADPIDSEIMVHFEDGNRLAARSLQDAIRRAVGRRAKVVLRNKEPLVVGSAPSQQLRISGGRVTIEAAEGARPVIDATLNAITPAILVSSDSSLTLSGITIRAERPLADPNAAPAVVQSAGNLRVERCALLMRGNNARARALVAEGNRLELINSFIQGFESPLVINCFSDLDARVEQSILVGTPDPAATGPPAAGWGALLSLRASPRSTERRLLFSHCTIIGAGLVRIDGPIDKVPVSIDVSHTIVAGHAIAMWPNLPFPSSLKWIGKGNIYSLGNDQLLVAAPGATSDPKSLPTDLATWAVDPAVVETESTERVLHFLAQPLGAGKQPADYRLIDAEITSAGADPTLVASPVQ